MEHYLRCAENIFQFLTIKIRFSDQCVSSYFSRWLLTSFLFIPAHANCSMMKSIFILLAVIAAAGCVSEQNIQPNDETQEQAVELENQTGIVEEENQTDTQPVNTVRLDCGNEIGNGDQIVSGPQSPGEGDRDNPFRSLTVNPSSPNVILVGTERNGFVRSSDGGNTWERFRYGVRHETEGYTEIYDIGIAANS